MTYVVADKYGSAGAKIGFVLPRTIFQSELGGWHFRQFTLPAGKKLSVIRVDDIDPLKPFRGQATNISCTTIFKVGESTAYPVDWFRWRKNDGEKITPNTTYKELSSRASSTKWGAIPVDGKQLQSPWLTGTPQTLTILKKVIGESFYKDLAREGINTRGANGVYFVDAWFTNNKLFVKNLLGEGRRAGIKEITQSIESDYLFPLLRGENVAQFSAENQQYIVLPHSTANPLLPVDFFDLPPRTQEYLAAFRKTLSERTKFRNFDPTGENWHGLYSVLQPTFAAHKVVWREMGLGIIAAAIGNGHLPDGSNKPIIPDHKLFLIPCESSDEADFVAGVLNSSVVNLIVASYAVSTGISTHILARIPLPKYQLNNTDHKKIVACSRNIRKSVPKSADTQTLVSELNAIVGKILGLRESEVAHTVSALKDFGIGT